MAWKQPPSMTAKYDDFDDDQVIVKIKDDPSVFAVLYERYFQRVYRYCLKRTSNVQIAEDLCSEIFVKVLKGLDSYRAGNFPAWLFRIAHNVIVDHYRKHKPIVALDDLQMKGETHMTQMVANQLLVAEILSELTDDERELITLRLEAEMTAPEIAERTGKTANAVRVQVYRLLKRLRDRYNVLMEDES